MPDPAVEREMRELCARLDAMETTQRQQLMLEMSVKPKEKMRLELKKKSQPKMLQKNVYSELLQESEPEKRWTFRCMKAT
jgi:hypothetical protein